MSDRKYVIGLDFGTLSGRALLVDAETGEEKASAVYEYSNGVIENKLPESGLELEPDTALQDPNDYLKVLKKTVPKVLSQAGVTPDEVIGLATDFTASSPLPCFQDGQPLCFDKQWRGNPHAWVKLWKHHAAQPEADAINELGRQRQERFVEVYGGKYSSEWSFSKLLQVVNDAPEVYDAMDRWIEAADWIVWQLTGEEKRSICTAGYKSMVVYPQDGKWTYPSSEFFAALHPKLGRVVEEKLSNQFYPLGGKAGTLTRRMAKMMGLNPGIAVAVGNVDAHVAVPACTVTTPGKMVLIMGTSTCNLLLGENFQPVEGMCGAVLDGVIPGYWGYEAGQSAVGDIFAWFIKQAVPEALSKKAKKMEVTTFNLLSQEAAALQPGQSGLLALDWWNGNRSILVDANLSGCIFGLTLASTPPEIYRALIEATAFGQRKIIDSFESQNIRINELYACGGLASKDEVLMQIYADVLGRPIYIAASDQTCALGSAMHAAVAAGYYPDIQTAAHRMARVKNRRFEPNATYHEIYNQLYAEYSRLHDLFGRHQLPTLKQLRSLRH